MKFRDDIDPANTWVVSDTHFGHENIVGYCARPEDHDQIILEQWRAHVPDDATVLHLGDLVWKSNGWFEHVIAPRLSGKRKLLILGNHDKGRPSWYKRCGFQLTRPFALQFDGADPCGRGLAVMAPDEPLTLMDYNVSFDHYPMDERMARNCDSNFWRLHGHIHNNGYHYVEPARDEQGHKIGEADNRLVPFLRNHINLSVEQTRYRPVNLKLLLDAAILGRLPQ